MDPSAWIEKVGVTPALTAIGAGCLVALAWISVARRRRAKADARRERAASRPRPATGSVTAPEAPRRLVQDPRPVPERTSGLHIAVASAPARTMDADRMLEALRPLGRIHEMGPLLQQIAEILGTEFGLQRVVVRIFNTRTRLYEARSFWGLPPHEMARISTVDVSDEEYVAMTLRASRVRGTWRIADSDRAWPDRLDHRSPPGVERSWSPENWQQSGIAAVGEGDHFVLPFPDEHEGVLGYACALAPARARSGDEALLAPLQTFAHFAAAEVRRARLRVALQRRELEYSLVAEQLREWQCMRDNFVSNISHELRTPLTSVKAYAETLARGFSHIDQATAAEFIGVIQHEATRLEQVFDDLLDVAHLDGRGRRVARDRIDLRGLVHELCRDWNERFVAQDVQLRVYGSTDELWIQGDVDGIRQVVEALLSNALKFTPGPGTVRVYVQEEAGTAQLTVEDTGIGVPEQERLRIFERFYQIDSSATRAYGGQGLGLALCREIVGWHHGRIWVEDAPSSGSRFVVMLPVRGLVVRQHADDPHADATERAQWEAFLQLTIHLVSELAGTRVASIMLVDELHDVLRIEAAVGLDEEVVQTTMIARGEAVAGVVWSENRSVLVPDLDAEERFRHLADDITYRPRSLLSVPLRWQGRTVGVLNVNTKLDGLPLDDDDRLLLEALADRIMLAFDSFDRYRAGYRRLASVESGVRAMLDVGRDRRTRLRELFARIGVETGRRLGLDEDHLRALSYALRTYDLGLAQVGTQILRKTAPLAPEERARIEEHTRLGIELVAELEPSPLVRGMILHHHENVDGTGYPSRLVGEAIPVGARIVRLADTFAALLHDRPFRDALSVEQAEQMLREGVYRRFCPRVTPVFLAVVEDRTRDLEELLRRDPGGDLGEIELERPARTR